MKLFISVVLPSHSSNPVLLKTDSRGSGLGGYHGIGRLPLNNALLKYFHALYELLWMPSIVLSILYREYEIQGKCSVAQI